MMAERGGPAGAKARARLEGPAVPDALAYLWGWFVVLDGMRTYHMGGPNPITADAIRAANELYGWGLSRMEADAIRWLDIAVRHPDSDDEDEPTPAIAPEWPAKGDADG